MAAEPISPSRGRVSTDPLAQHLPAARRRLYDLVVGQVHADGAIRDRCASRPLESALFLQFLRKQRALPVVQDEIAAYLRAAIPSTPLDQIIIAGAIGYPDRSRATSYLNGFSHSTGKRKQLVLATLLALCGAIPLDQALDPVECTYTRQATWTDLTLCAIRILSCPATDQRTDREFLVRKLEDFGPGPAWEGNVLAHLIALHALQVFRSDSTLLRDGVDAIARLRNPDGGVPFIVGQEVWVTALAGMALARAGAPHPLLTRMGDYLAARQLPCGGWGYDETTTQSDVDDTTRCVQFLRQTDSVRYHRSLKAAEKYLIAIADSDSGGFPTYIKGLQSEADLTAGALLALTPSTALFQKSAKFLLDAQNPNGTFEQSWTLSRTSVIAHVLEALYKAQFHIPALTSRIRVATARSATHLHGTQNQDGGWSQSPGGLSDVLSTAHAIPALASAETQDRAVGWLLAHQRSDGGFASPPDQVGPRPLPYDFPILASVHALTALNAAGGLSILHIPGRINHQHPATRAEVRGPRSEVRGEDSRRSPRRHIRPAAPGSPEAS